MCTHHVVEELVEAVGVRRVRLERERGGELRLAVVDRLALLLRGARRHLGNELAELRTGEGGDRLERLALFREHTCSKE